MSDNGIGDGDGDADADTGGQSLCYHADSDLIPTESASILVTDRSFLHGDVTLKTLRAYGGGVFHWDAHADRLAETCDALGMDHGLFDNDLRARIDETLATSDLDEAYVRLPVARDSQGDRLTPVEAVDPRVVIIMEPLSRGGRGPDSVWGGPATVQTIKTRRVPNRSLPTRTKTHNYLNGILVHVELRVTGTDEALMLGADGYATKDATNNLFFVDDGALCTPNLGGPAPPGITRRAILDLTRQKGVPIREWRFTPDDMRDANETFLTDSTWELRPVEAVNGIEVGDGPVAKLLSRLYDNYVGRRHYDGDGGGNDVGNGGDADSVGGDEN